MRKSQARASEDERGKRGFRGGGLTPVTSVRMNKREAARFLIFHDASGRGVAVRGSHEFLPAFVYRSSAMAVCGRRGLSRTAMDLVCSVRWETYKPTHTVSGVEGTGQRLILS